MSSSVSLPTNWAVFLKDIADDHDIDVGKVISGLCDWAFSSADSKVQFEVWLDKTYSPKGQAEDKAQAEGEETNEAEEERLYEDEEEVN